MTNHLPPRPSNPPRVAEPRSLLDEPRAITNSQISVSVTEDDTRAAMWIGHKWTKRLVWGGVPVIAGIVMTLAGAWGNAVLEQFEGLRADFASYSERVDERLTAAEKERSTMATAAAVVQQRLTEVESRLGKLEARLEGYIYQRYGASQRNYEQRHDIPAGRRAHIKAHSE